MLKSFFLHKVVLTSAVIFLLTFETIQISSKISAQEIRSDNINQRISSARLTIETDIETLKTKENVILGLNDDDSKIKYIKLRANLTTIRYLLALDQIYQALEISHRRATYTENAGFNQKINLQTIGELEKTLLETKTKIDQMVTLADNIGSSSGAGGKGTETQPNLQMASQDLDAMKQISSEIKTDIKLSISKLVNMLKIIR